MDELLKHCRYYQGGDKPLSDDSHIRAFWSIEKSYVMNDGKLLQDEEYLYNKLHGKSYSGIAKNLLLYLFCYYLNGVYDIENSLDGFNELIDKYYLEIPSDIFPKDEIPYK